MINNNQYDLFMTVYQTNLVFYSGSTDINKLKNFTSARLFCFIDIFIRKIWKLDLDRKSTNLMQNWMCFEDGY